MHITAENKDPAGAAIPIGRSVSGNNFDAKYAPGILTSSMDARLDIKESVAFSYAQKNPQKQK